MRIDTTTSDPDPRPTEQEHGRPTGPTDEDGLRSGVEHHEAPTEAAEERGHEPDVELAPGADL